jgi:leucine-zipper of insertion element IS481
MKLHSNATTCQHSRELLVRRVLEQRWTLARAAEAAGVRVRTVSKWLRRYRAEGEAGVADRHSEPKRIANRAGAVGEVVRRGGWLVRRDLRRVRRGGPVGGSHRGPQRRRRAKTTSFAVTNFRDGYKRGYKIGPSRPASNKKPEFLRRDPPQRDAAAATREHRCSKRGSGFEARFWLRYQRPAVRTQGMPVRRRGERLSSAQHGQNAAEPAGTPLNEYLKRRPTAERIEQRRNPARAEPRRNADAISEFAPTGGDGVDASCLHRTVIRECDVTSDRGRVCRDVARWDVRLAPYFRSARPARTPRRVSRSMRRHSVTTGPVDPCVALEFAALSATSADQEGDREPAPAHCARPRSLADDAAAD